MVASRHALFGLPEVVQGVLPTCGALFPALQVLSPNVARELLVTGEPLDAQRPCRCRPR